MSPNFRESVHNFIFYEVRLPENGILIAKEKRCPRKGTFSLLLVGLASTYLIPLLSRLVSHYLFSFSFDAK